MERVGVLVHPTRPVQRAVEILQRWTEDRGLELVQIPAGEQPPVASSGEVSACDLVTALGGDGTILKALHAAARTRTPVLGVACGSLGVLTTVQETELRAALDRFAAGDWLARHLPALDVVAGGAHIGSAINDLVLARHAGTQLVVQVCLDGELYVRMAGDGIVVATPVGSSAYSMAAGGPLLAAGANALVCTPLAMHGGCAPPLVVPDNRQVEIKIDPGHGGFDLEVDGFPLRTDAHHFSVSSQHAYATLVVLDGSADDLPWLRERGLISDSPRVVARESRELRETPEARAITEKRPDVN
jgi:NAD+ kinase